MFVLWLGSSFISEQQTSEGLGEVASTSQEGQRLLLHSEYLQLQHLRRHPNFISDEWGNVLGKKESEDRSCCVL